MQLTGERFLIAALNILLSSLPKFGSNLPVYFIDIFYMNEIKNFLVHSLQSLPLDFGRN